LLLKVSLSYNKTYDSSKNSKLKGIIIKEEIVLSLKFTKKLFLSEDGFGIFTTDKDYSAKGYILDDPASLIDSQLELQGHFEKSQKYGDTFVFHSYKQKSSNYYFLSNMVKGVTESIAKKMLKKYGDDLYNVIENTPRELLSISGVGEKRLEKIINSYKKISHIKKLAEFIGSYGVNNAVILNIYNHFGDGAIDIIKENAYELTTIRGIAFKKADLIAMNIGKQPNDIFRIQSGVLYTINQYVNMQGSTCLSYDILFNETCSIVNIQDNFTLDNNLFDEAINNLINDETIVRVKDFFALKTIYDMETFIIDTIKEYSQVKEDILDFDDLNEMMQNIQKSMSISLSQEQKEAINLANQRHRIFSICGYAGTGKSTISKIVLQLMSRIYPVELMVCCSLSGVAANRIKHLSGFDAFTIHSLLRFKGVSFEFNKNNKLPHRVVLLDEASMVNIPIFYALLQAIDFDKGAILILVGDIAQLPPIGAGDVYCDIVNSKLSPSCKLETIYRQKNQVIKLFASYIRKGKTPIDYLGKYEDFLFIPIESNEEILNTMLSVASQYQDMKYLYTKDTIIRYISYFQVISPIKNHLLGVKNLNFQIKKILNPSVKININILSYDFGLRDKVIHLKNKNMPVFGVDEFKEIDISNLKSASSITQKRVFNGQRGVISHIDKKNNYIFVYYPIEEYIVWYKSEDIKENILDLAYAMSGHKTQGSEFENVLIPITYSHYMMLHTRLMYTMITRVEKKLILVGSTKAFSIACEKIETNNRETIMKQEMLIK